MVAQIVGEDTSPAMKRGGYVNRVRKHIRCLCPGDQIPAFVEVNVGGLEVGEKVGLEALAFPQGVVHLERVGLHLASDCPAYFCHCMNAGAVSLHHCHTSAMTLADCVHIHVLLLKQLPDVSLLMSGLDLQVLDQPVVKMAGRKT